MKKINKLLYKWLLPKILAVKTDFKIPRSGEEGKKVNCFCLHFDHEQEPYFLAESFEEEKLKGLIWDGSSYNIKGELYLSELDDYKFTLKHFYGLYDINFSSIAKFAIQYISKYIYIKINLHKTISSTSQYFFNKKRLVTVKRMELLQFMLDQQLDKGYKSVGVIELMTKLYSTKWLSHPSADDQRRKLKIYLDSLVETGELIKDSNYSYIVTGKAISTIEKYEEAEQRHVDSVRLQRRMIKLTLLLVFVGLLQAGVIKIPIMDFTKTRTTQLTNNK